MSTLDISVSFILSSPFQLYTSTFLPHTSVWSVDIPVSVPHTMLYSLPIPMFSKFPLNASVSLPSTSESSLHISTFFPSSFIFPRRLSIELSKTNITYLHTPVSLQQISGSFSQAEVLLLNTSEPTLSLSMSTHYISSDRLFFPISSSISRVEERNTTISKRHPDTKLLEKTHYLKDKTIISTDHIIFSKYFTRKFNKTDKFDKMTTSSNYISEKRVEQEVNKTKPLSTTKIQNETVIQQTSSVLLRLLNGSTPTVWITDVTTYKITRQPSTKDILQVKVRVKNISQPLFLSKETSSVLSTKHLISSEDKTLPTSEGFEVFSTRLITDEFIAEAEVTTETVLMTEQQKYEPHISSVHETKSISDLHISAQAQKSLVQTMSKVKPYVSVKPDIFYSILTSTDAMHSGEISSKERKSSVEEMGLNISLQPFNMTLYQADISTTTAVTVVTSGYIRTSQQLILKYSTAIYYTKLIRSKSWDRVTKDPIDKRLPSSKLTKSIFPRFNITYTDNTTFTYGLRDNITYMHRIRDSKTFTPELKDNRTLTYGYTDGIYKYNKTHSFLDSTISTIDKTTSRLNETYKIIETTTYSYQLKDNIYMVDLLKGTIKSTDVSVTEIFTVTSEDSTKSSILEYSRATSIKLTGYLSEFNKTTQRPSRIISSAYLITVSPLYDDSRQKVRRYDTQSQTQRLKTFDYLVSFQSGYNTTKHFTSKTIHSLRDENSTTTSDSYFISHLLASTLLKTGYAKTSLQPRLSSDIRLLESIQESTKMHSENVSALSSARPVPSGSSRTRTLVSIPEKTVSFDVKLLFKTKFEIPVSENHTSSFTKGYRSVQQEHISADILYSNTIDLLSTTDKNVTVIPVSFTIDTSLESAVIPTVSQHITIVSATSKHYNLTTSGSYTPKLTTPFVKETDKTFSSFVGYVLNGDDEISRPLHLPSTVAFGTGSYDILYISTNGYITFGKKQNFPSPQRFPDPPNAAIIAPFWSDLVVDEPGRVTYKFFEIGTKNFHAATKLVKSHDEKSLFKKWILIITWENVQPSSRLKNVTEMATFQMALVPTQTEKRTFFIFSYLPGMQSWTKTLEHTEVSIGFSDGNHNYKQNEYSFSLSALELYHIKGNTGKQGVWVEKIENDLDLRRQQCINYAHSSDDWTNALSHTCPCIQTQAKADFRFKFISRENGITKFESIFAHNGLKEQCVYSNSSFGETLITDSPLGGSISVLNTDTLDKHMKKFCCEGIPSYCNLYYSRRPSSTCKNYLPPKLGWSWGDPHFHTIDGNDYTFNGWGEYEMIYMVDDTFRMQIRIEDSISTGFAMKTLESPIIEFTMVDCIKDVRILINQTEKYSMSLMNGSLDNPNFLIKKQNNSLLITFRNGIAVKITPHLEILTGIVSIPSEINDVTYGLLGFANNNITDDFLGRNGQMWPTNSSDRQLFEFGETWRVRVNESLFTYTKKRTFSSYHNLSFVPRFFDEMNLTLLFSGNTALLEETMQQCSNYSFYEACLQDSAKMQDVQAAIQGAEMHTEALSLQKYFEQIIPILKQTPKVLSVQIYKNLTFKLELERNISTPVSFRVKTNCKNYQFDEKTDKFYKVACICPKNFGGDQCEVRPCNLSHCHENVRCKEKSGIPVCGNCPFSMVGTGKFEKYLLGIKYDKEIYL
eukprot:XP_014785347.1 PREDICTED: mucin-4-like [Octopus bimaculoides]